MFGRKIRWIGASTAAAVGTLGVIAIMPANAATTSVTLTGKVGEVSAAATGTVVLVATQRGDHLTVASDASLTLSGSCTSAKKRGDWFVAVCDTQFGDHLAVNLATPGSKLAVNARNMIASVQGSTGDDSISVRAMVATVDGGDGNDAIDADGGYGVHVTGGAGDDTIHVQSTPIQGMNTAPVADGGDGNDTLIGSDDSDHLSGGAGNDTILGGDGNDFIDGGAGSDRIDGGKGADRITGDTFASDPAARIADDGTDTLFYGKVKGDWSVTQDSDPNDGSRVDRYYWDDAHQSYYMDEVSGFEQVVPQPMPS